MEFAYDRSLWAYLQFPCLRLARVAEEVDSGRVVGDSTSREIHICKMYDTVADFALLN